MEHVMNAVKSPDLINFADGDYENEVQYKSLQTANGVVTTTTDTEVSRRKISSRSDTGSDAEHGVVDADSGSADNTPSAASSPVSDSVKTATPHNSTMFEERCQLLDTCEESEEETHLLSSDAAGDGRVSASMNTAVDIDDVALATPAARDDDDCEVWCVSDVQRKYYVHQFLSLQPDIDGVVDGLVAKAFFEKSKLPVAVLSQIWKLADVTKDGCLCLQEFITAMHLVVLKRNNIDVPQHLPASLLPAIVHSREAAVACDVNAIDTNNSSANNSLELPSPRAREWTKFMESPLSGISTSSARPANFDFHKSSIAENPSIAHPLAVRGTQEEHQRLRSDDDDCSSDNCCQDFSSPPATAAAAALSEGAAPPTAFSRVNAKQSSVAPVSCDDGAVTGANGPTSLPPFSSQSASRPLNSRAPPPLPPPRLSGDTAAGGLTRPLAEISDSSAHTRSNSLDLARAPVQQPPPLPPPRSSPSQSKATAAAVSHHKHEPSAPVNSGLSSGERSARQAASESAVSFADFAQFEDGGGTASPSPMPRQLLNRNSARSTSSVSGVIKSKGRDADDRLMGPPSGDLITADSDDVFVMHSGGKPSQLWRLSARQLLNMTDISRERLVQLVRMQRQRTLTLSQVAAELNQELSETIEERVALEIQLQHMSSEDR